MAERVGVAIEAREAFETLVHLGQRKTGRIPPDLLVRHVLTRYSEADWPVQRAALEALLRRIEFARRDGLRVTSRPARHAPFGAYETRPSRGPTRPYRTLLRRLEPLEASCDCADFVRSSLGLCKHLLAVLDDLAAKPARLARAQKSDGAPPPLLAWDPVRPLLGLGDWLERVRLSPDASAAARARERLRRARRHFAAGDARYASLRATWPSDPGRRRTLVEDLLALATAPGADGRLADPALVALLRQERSRLDVAAGGGHPPLRGLRRRLYHYQRDGVMRFLASGRLLLADDMGLGKTVQAIASCHALYRAKRVERGLLIVPASLKGQWLREWEATSDVPVALVDGSPQQRAHAYRVCRRGFLVANYEQVLRDLAPILEWDPGIVVLDEAQRIKNWATKTAAFVKRIRPPYRLVLTGTPMENRLEELASLMDWVDDHALEPKWRLVPWHSVFADGSREVVGVRHLETLRQRLAPSMVRRVRQEVLDQLPPRTDTVVPVEMSDAQREEHDALVVPIAQLMKRAQRRPLTQAEFLRLMSLLTTQRIIANGMAQYRFPEVWPRLERSPDREGALAELASPKLAELRALVTGLAVDQGRKVVVFSQWRRMLRLAAWAVEDVLAEGRLRAAFFTGEESQRQRTRNLVEFHDDPATRVLFATDAGGVGLNLQRAANACITCDLPWNPAVLEQRIGRIHRLGQADPIDVYSLVSQDSIESRIARLVSDKRAVFRSLFDGESDAVRFDRSGSFLASLERLFGDAPEPPVGEDDEDEPEEGADLGGDTLPPAPQGAPRPAPEPAVETAPVSPGATRPVAPSTLEAVQVLFADFSIQRTPQGRVRLEASPEVAAGLASLLHGLAQTLLETTRR
jgi:superfamily II DNA or RNA helicase